MEYFNSVKSTIEELRSVLGAKGIESRFLTFGGEGPEPEKKIRVPTDARSEFLANRAMGDWAESTLAAAINQASHGSLKAIQYGDTDSTAAGEKNFAERYLASKEETRRYGKRPDLLVVKSGLNVPNDISEWNREMADNVVAQAEYAIEVRSSKFKALKYMEVRRQEKLDSGKKAANESPSFTVKVEDLCIVYRWLEVTKAKQFYAQVFFDSVFAIDVKGIFEIIASGAGFKIDKPEKSQLKSTIMIPITSGVQIGSFKVPPFFDVDIRETKTGRVDAYVVPKGGEISLIEQKMVSLLSRDPQS